MSDIDKAIDKAFEGWSVKGCYMANNEREYAAYKTGYAQAMKEVRDAFQAETDASELVFSRTELETMRMSYSRLAKRLNLELEE